MILELALSTLVDAILREYEIDTSDTRRVASTKAFVAGQLRRAPDVLRQPIQAAVLSLRLTKNPLELRHSGTQARRDALRLVESLVIYRWFDDSEV
ncbi:MAG: hypothetical protein HY791_24035 [Deltaproteobacteria bacterium]|nr:hypothetical protein [Deltaproteobacteria bacterium]